MEKLNSNAEHGQVRCDELMHQSERMGLYAVAIAEWAKRLGKKLNSAEVITELMNQNSTLLSSLWAIGQRMGLGRKQCDDELVRDYQFIVSTAQTILDATKAPKEFEEIQIETIKRILEKAGVDISFQGVSSESH